MPKRRSLQHRGSISIEAKRARRVIVHDLAMKIKSLQELNPVKSGANAEIAASALVHPWMTRDMFFSYLKRYKKKKKKW